MNRLILIVSALALSTSFAQAAEPAGGASKKYVWGKMLPEQVEILKLTGDVTRGKEAFSACKGCHKNDAGGIVDGTYPKLAGQHSSVIIKQVTEVRAGARINPKMEPFAGDHAVTQQEIADIAVYLQSLETVRENGKGPGKALARGKVLYEKGRCDTCHGEHGEGDASRAYPVVASQHFEYLRREMDMIQKGTRGNSHPRMVKAIANYSRDDIEAVADYMSRMPDYRSVAKK